MPGTANEMSWIEVKPFCASSSPPMAVMATGTSTRRCERFCAVTITSSTMRSCAMQLTAVVEPTSASAVMYLSRVDMMPPETWIPINCLVLIVLLLERGHCAVEKIIVRNRFRALRFGTGAQHHRHDLLARIDVNVLAEDAARRERAVGE